VNRPVDFAISIAKQNQAMSAPQSLQGIVSPCSVCVNQRISQAADGRPGCPRRSAVSLKQEMDDNGADTSSLSLVVLTGIDGASDDGTQPLANPVYDSSSNSILIWTAGIKDNPPKVDPVSGAMVSPGLLDPAFSTDWISCMPFPVAPRDSEAQYFQKGALMEGDQVEVLLVPQQQIVSDSVGGSYAINVPGTAQKVNFHSLFPRVPVDQDLCPAGT
jgi:hypothetical protein